MIIDVAYRMAGDNGLVGLKERVDSAPIEG